ncbi:bifunctional DNA-formamidopyrimidine glycosylase/DNA-(apurinic or apyrimidinic site) lyase [Burkholderiales bacterium]|nr:bifunctional DNA-formamidopyrimidine glycosylase/DNA-(apurinic or apyrimidinic site) lyase [Burkholderiales bacterium]
MPELPEVEITKRGIEPFLVGQTIEKIVLRNLKLRWPIPKKLRTILPSLKIRSIERRAKYILIDCSAGWLIIHLGMSGSLRLLSSLNEAPTKHDHYDLYTTNNTIIRYRDPRKFGALIWTTGNPYDHRLIKHLGPEPLSEEFNREFLYQKLRSKSSKIKLQIMNNQVVTGVGNIYANESLFHAGISPIRQANKVTRPKLELLIVAIKATLERAICAGGSSLQDFYLTDGSTGYFQQQYMVYGRAGKPCHKCKTTIKSVILGQRSSFYCPKCQK